MIKLFNRHVQGFENLTSAAEQGAFSKGVEEFSDSSTTKPVIQEFIDHMPVIIRKPAEKALGNKISAFDHLRDLAVQHAVPDGQSVKIAPGTRHKFREPLGHP